MIDFHVGGALYLLCKSEPPEADCAVTVLSEWHWLHQVSKTNVASSSYALSAHSDPYTTVRSQNYLMTMCTQDSPPFLN